MKKIKVILVTFFFSTLVANQHGYLDLQKLGQEQYQDIIINGKVVSQGVRDCASRYEALKQVLDKYERPFMLLDIGASQGYFALRIAHDYPHATCVMIEGNYHDRWRIADQLQDICRLNTDLDNIIFLKKKISAAELQRLGECEHFDVVLCFNVIHHVKHEWQKMIIALFSLGDNIIIETPPANDSIARGNKVVAGIERELIKRDGIIIAKTPRHTSKTYGSMFWFEQQKHDLFRTDWHNALLEKPIKLSVSYQKKQIVDTIDHTVHNWYMGIKRTTFESLNGVYPTKNMILDDAIIINKLRE